MWELLAKDVFVFKMAPPGGHFWCVSYMATLYHPYELGTVSNIHLDCHQSAT